VAPRRRPSSRQRSTFVSRPQERIYILSWGTHLEDPFVDGLSVSGSMSVDDAVEPGTTIRSPGSMMSATRSSEPSLRVHVGAGGGHLAYPECRGNIPAACHVTEQYANNPSTLIMGV
jgi:hypothetical protein